MAAKVRAFRGLIYANFDSEAEFARKLNWPRQKVHKISNGVKQPDLQEIDEMSKTLDVPPNELLQIFLDYKSPNRQLISS